MLEIFGLMFEWLPPNLRAAVISGIVLFVLFFFVGLVIKIIQLFRG